MTFNDRMLAVVVAALWGGNCLAIHYGLGHFPPLLLGSLRFLVLAVPTVLFVRRPNVRWRWLLGYGLGFGTAQFAFLFLAMAYGLPTGLASLVLQASAPFTVLLGALILGERMSSRQTVGIGAAVTGLVVIAVARSTVAPVLPLVLCLLGALGWALGNLCSRQAGSDDPVRFTLWTSVVPPIPLFLLSWFVEGPKAIGTALTTAVTPAGLPGLAALGYLVLCATVLGAGAWTSLMRRYPAGLVAPFSLLVPIVGMTLSFVLLAERPSWMVLVAGAVIVAGVLFGTPRAPKAPPQKQQPLESELCWPRCGSRASV